MHRAYSLKFPRARLFPCQTCIYRSRALIQGSGIPSAAHVNHTQHGKRLIHTGQTEIQPPGGDTPGGKYAQARSSQSPREIARRLFWSRKIQVIINGRMHIFDSLCLRDACPCERCIDQSTTQKLFDTQDIPTDIRGKDTEVHPDGSFSISWTSDIPGYAGHRSHFPRDFYKHTYWNPDYAVKRRQRKYPRLLWDQYRLEQRQLQMNVTYDEYLTNETLYRDVVIDLLRYGIAFIKKVPNVLGSVTEIGNRMGGLKNTIYGPTWDVRSLPSAKNVADTSANLGFHMVSRNTICEADGGPASLVLVAFCIGMRLISARTFYTTKSHRNCKFSIV